MPGLLQWSWNYFQKNTWKILTHLNFLRVILIKKNGLARTHFRSIHAIHIIGLLVRNFKMRYNDWTVNATHTHSSVIFFAVEVWDALEDMKIEICTRWLDFVEVFRNRNFKYNFCFFYQTFLLPVCCRSAWNLSDVFRSSNRVVHVKTAVHNSVPTSQLHHYVICHKLTSDTAVNLRNKEVSRYVCKAFVEDPVKRGFYVSWFYVFLNFTHFFSVPTDFRKRNLIYSLNPRLFFLIISLILHSNWTLSVLLLSF